MPLEMTATLLGLLTCIVGAPRAHEVAGEMARMDMSDQLWEASTTVAVWEYYREHLFPGVPYSRAVQCLEDKVSAEEACVVIPRSDPPRELCFRAEPGFTRLDCDKDKQACHYYADGSASDCVCPSSSA